MLTTCHVCHGAHAVEPTYACAGCGRVLCETQLGLHAGTGWHVVTVGSRSRICGHVARLPIQSNMTTATPAGWRTAS